MIIILDDNFFIDIDPLNYALRQKYIGVRKDNQKKEAVRTYGYYGKLEDALRKYVELYCRAEISDIALSVEDFIKKYIEASEKAVRAIQAKIIAGVDDGK